MTSVAPIHREVTRNMRAVLAYWDLDQGVIASWLHVSISTVSRLMSGHRPWTLDYLQVIADKLEISVSVLTGSTSEMMREISLKSEAAGGVQNLKSKVILGVRPASMCAA